MKWGVVHFCIFFMVSFDCDIATQPNADQSDDLNVPGKNEFTGTWKRSGGSIGYLSANGKIDSIRENTIDAGTRYVTFNDSFYILFGYHTNYQCRFPQIAVRYGLNFDTLYLPAIDNAAAATWEAEGYEYNNIRTVKIMNGVLKLSNEIQIMSRNNNLSPYIFYEEYVPVAEIDSSDWPVDVCR